MKIVNNDKNHPLTPAELEALRQFEESGLEGQVLFHPMVGAGEPALSCVAFVERIGRFVMVIPEGRQTVRNGQWWRQEANGVQTPVDDDPLDQVWQAAGSVRTALKGELDIGAYVIAVVWFPDMEEDEDILDKVGGRNIGLLFGQVDLPHRLARLPREKELQLQLNRRFIEQEVAVLSRPSGTKAEPEPAEVSDPVIGRAVALTINGGVGTVNVYITVVNGGEDDDPPLITVEGR